MLYHEFFTFRLSLYLSDVIMAKVAKEIEIWEFWTNINLCNDVLKAYLQALYTPDL